MISTQFWAVMVASQQELMTIWTAYNDIINNYWQEYQYSVYNKSLRSSMLLYRPHFYQSRELELREFKRMFLMNIRTGANGTTNIYWGEGVSVLDLSHVSCHIRHHWRLDSLSPASLQPPRQENSKPFNWCLNSILFYRVFKSLLALVWKLKV